MSEILAAKEADERPIPVETFLQEQAEDRFCKPATETARQLQLQDDHDRYRLLLRKSAADGMLQRIFPKCLIARLPYLVHYQRLTGLPRGSRM